MRNLNRFNNNFLSAGILLIVLVFFSIIPAYVTLNFMRDRIETVLFNKAKQVDTYIDEYTIKSLKDPYAASLLYHLFRGEPTEDSATMRKLWENTTAPLGLENDFYRIRNFKWQVVFRSKNLTAEEERKFDTLFMNSTNMTQYVYMKINGVAYCAINCPVTFSHFNYLNLQLAIPISLTQAIFDDSMASYSCGIILILILCAYYFFRTKE